MKNYLKITMGLVLASMIVSCSDEDNTIVPETNPDPVIPTEGTFILPAPAVESNIPEHNFLMGALFSFQKNLRNGEDAASGGTSSTTFYNKPLFEVKSFGATETEWWDNLVEEMVYSGLDYVAPNCRGRLPKADTDPAYDRDHGDPTRIKDFIAALQRRNEENLKIAIFDDCPASWAAARNFDLYQTYATFINAETQQNKGLTDEEVMYPLDNLDDIYKYIWDYNIKLAFDNFYGENKANNKYLLRIDGKPVLFLWSINGFLNVDYAALGNKKIDCKGKLKTILNKIHADFKSAYGEDLFICADRAFQDRDKEVDESVVESLNDWFIAAEQAPTRSSWTVRTFNGKTVGVAVPAFYTNDKSGTRMFFDADHLKMVNDKYGHDMGNVVIGGIADAIKRSFPHEAVAMRYGGDEFVVLIPDCNEQKAKNMEKSFHKTLKDMTSAKKLQFDIEASSGFVIVVDNSRSLDDYINEADELMYQAKKRHKAQRD